MVVAHLCCLMARRGSYLNFSICSKPDHIIKDSEFASNWYSYIPKTKVNDIWLTLLWINLRKPPRLKSNLTSIKIVASLKVFSYIHGRVGRKSFHVSVFFLATFPWIIRIKLNVTLQAFEEWRKRLIWLTFVDCVTFMLLVKYTAHTRDKFDMTIPELWDDCDGKSVMCFIYGYIFIWISKKLKGQRAQRVLYVVCQTFGRVIAGRWRYTN